MAHDRLPDGGSDIVVVRDLRKSYRLGEIDVPVLRGVGFSVPRGSLTAIVGASGSGKTTLLGLLGGLDQPDSGSLVVAGQDIARFSRRALIQYRAHRIGFVFQFYNLLPTLTALENVELGLEFVGKNRRERGERARHYLGRVGLTDMADKYPGQLSGGEQQRLAVARALAREPDLILADEPTGNLDNATGEQVFGLICQLLHDAGLTCLLVTHNRELAARTDRVIELRNGVVSE